MDRASIAAVVDDIAQLRAPYMIGVRHHSPALASAIPALLDNLQPDCVCIELPTIYQKWLAWLGRQDLHAPVALAAHGDGGDTLLSFYPMADFSPELAAIRWAHRRDVAVFAIDHPSPSVESDRRSATQVGPITAPTYGKLQQNADVDDGEMLWEQLVESRATGSTAEEIRRAALLMGWLQREHEAHTIGISQQDLVREEFMSSQLARHVKAYDQVCAVVGAFHAPVLRVDASAVPSEATPVEETTPATTLIPYTFRLLDSRSGYPAGIRDPAWRQAVWERPAAVHETAVNAIVSVATGIRERGLSAGVPDGTEATRMAFELADIRDLPAPGRREVLEAIETTMARGNILGRGRVIAAALEQVMVSDRRGELPRDLQSTGLSASVPALLKQLKLPTENAANKRIKLDPLRSPLDRQRALAFRQLNICAIPYAERNESPTLAKNKLGETLTEIWTVAWTPAVSAMLSLHAHYGATLPQATRGLLYKEYVDAVQADRLTPRVLLGLSTNAAEAGLADFLEARLAELHSAVLRSGDLEDIVTTVNLLERITAGHVVGISCEQTPRLPDTGSLIDAAIAALDGVQRSDQDADALSMRDLVVSTFGRGRPTTRLAWALRNIHRQGAPLMQGTAAACISVYLDDTLKIIDEIRSWIEVAVTTDARTALSRRLHGVFVVASRQLETDQDFVGELAAIIAALDDQAFLARLPALRRAFGLLSATTRQLLLDNMRGSIGHFDDQLEITGELASRYAQADVVGGQAVDALALEAE